MHLFFLAIKSITINQYVLFVCFDYVQTLSEMFKSSHVYIDIKLKKSYTIFIVYFLKALAMEK
jgi:hypothetical protein